MSSLKKYFNFFSENSKDMIRRGTKVKWKWSGGIAKGKVIEAFTETAIKTIKGQKVVRNGEEGNKALYIQQEDGTKVLKLESEVERDD